jgi:large subunit ribosomal protein L23
VVFNVRRRAPSRRSRLRSKRCSVKVKAVNTLNRKGKVKRFRGIAAARADVKKAIVTLEEGQSIDVTTGL